MTAQFLTYHTDLLLTYDLNAGLPIRAGQSPETTPASRVIFL